MNWGAVLVEPETLSGKPVLSQNGFYGILVFTGNRNGLAADGDDIRSSQGRIGKIDQKGTMDAEEASAKNIFPLADTRPVAVLMSVTRMDPNLGVSGFDEENIFLFQGDLPVVGIECDKSFGRILLVQPLQQQEMPVCEQGENGCHKDWIPKHGRHIPPGVAGSIDDKGKEQLP